MIRENFFAQERGSVLVGPCNIGLANLLFRSWIKNNLIQVMEQYL